MPTARLRVLICTGAVCEKKGASAVESALRARLGEFGLDDEVRILTSDCVGYCKQAPVMIVYPDDVMYVKVHPRDVHEIIEEHFLKGRPVRRLMDESLDAKDVIANMRKTNFFKGQELRIVMENAGIINPASIEDYIGRDGYSALAKVLTEMTPQEVIHEVKISGLRGRGGGGFPTGVKWDFVARAEGERKYVVCNADEGDPGAFMDRNVLEGDPHRVLEAMAIAGYAVGAEHGIIYCRAEYPLAIEMIEKGIAAARQYGLLGKNIFETPFNFDIELRIGAGAFVCGEETALLHSIEGKRGQPSPKPPFPAIKGLWGMPTLINNVETFACIPPIIRNGGAWFASIGTERSKGTKVFALAGRVRNTGIVEVPMGTTLRQIIFDIGGGIPDGKQFKAAQTGGPSGGCIPKQFLDISMEYETLKEIGSMMGSGGLIVMDEDTCMVDVAKFFMEFCVSESCGKCPPCRVGTKQLYDILDRITKGQGQPEDIDRMLELGKMMQRMSLCGLGQSAPNPVLSTLRYFRKEYEEHIIDKRCKAGVCTALFTAPCENACPCNVDAAGYVQLAAEGRFIDALLLHRERNPLPAICGRVCHHPCMTKCRRGQTDRAIDIRAIKRYISLYEKELPIERIKPTKDKVAIVGTGPAGLTIAYFLAKKGYEVVMFEALPYPGGTLRFGIPAYRLPREVIDQEVKMITDMGVRIVYGVKVGKNITIDQIFALGYKAICLAIGAHVSYKLGVKGEHLAGVVGGMDFLRDFNIGYPMMVRGKRVVVVGGGNTAMDAARTALRLGAKSVEVLYRRLKEDMPALKEEIEEAINEGVKFTFLVTPLEAIGVDGHVVALKCARMRLGAYDDTGRRKTSIIEGSEFEIPVDMVIPALGQEPESHFAEVEKNILVDPKYRTFLVDERTRMTNVPGVFAAGDDTTGPAMVADAIGDGQRVAAAVDRFLGGDGILWKPRTTLIPVTTYDEHDYVETRKQFEQYVLPVEERAGNFNEVERGLSRDQVMEEARHCLHCDRASIAPIR
ncbi:MAG: NADH-quinone oxidoreductase subunit NuoF [bacterium]|nr:NADH-quinone oxidoreductase subunit NuoF [bacterium]